MYDHVVPHLRLSDRHLIVKDYPGDAKWWANEERKSEPNKIHLDTGVSEAQNLVLECIRGGEKSRSELCAELGMKESRIRNLIDGLTRVEQVYEYEGESTGGRRKVMYGLLEGA